MKSPELGGRQQGLMRRVPYVQHTLAASSLWTLPPDQVHTFLRSFLFPWDASSLDDLSPHLWGPQEPSAPTSSLPLLLVPSCRAPELSLWGLYKEGGAWMRQCV